MSTPVSQNQQAKCLTAKEKAYKAAGDAVSKGKDLLIQIGSGFVQIVLAPVTAILAEIKKQAQAIQDEYYRVLELPQKYDKIRAEKWAEIKKKWNELTTPANCEPIPPPVTSTTTGVAGTTPPITVTTNVVAQTMASPSSNDPTLNTATPEYEKKKLVEDSMSKSVNEQVIVTQNIMSSFDTLSVQSLRETIRQMSGKRSDIDEALSTSPYGKMQSEYVGSHIIAYGVDKPSLQLKNWQDGTPVILRKNIEQKLSSDQSIEVKKAYDITNRGLYNNLPKEFKDEQTTFGMVSHSYHLAGDYFYYKNHANSDTIVGKSLVGATLATIGTPNKLINYINPVIENITIENTPLLVIEENYEVPVDNRKNIVRRPLKTNQTLLPLQVNTL
jgi:hypothetical protein